MIHVARTSRSLAYAAAPLAVSLVAGFLWDGDFTLVAPVTALASFGTGLFSYVRNPEGRWWLAALLGGLIGSVLGIAMLFHIGSQI